MGRSLPGTPPLRECWHLVGDRLRLRTGVIHQRRDEELTGVVKITLGASGKPAGKLADAELHFTAGVVAGLKLVGFAVWNGRNGGRAVTVPARRYSADGRHRTFTLLRDVSGYDASQAVRHLIFRTYHEAEAREAQPPAVE